MLIFLFKNQYVIFIQIKHEFYIHIYVYIQVCIQTFIHHDLDHQQFFLESPCGKGTVNNFWLSDRKKKKKKKNGGPQFDSPKETE